MTDQIYYLIENKVYPKDLERYGCDYFSIKKTFLDFTPLIYGLNLNPKKIRDIAIKEINTLEDLELEQIKDALIIDFLSNSKSANKIRKLLIKNNKIVKRVNLYFSNKSIYMTLKFFINKILNIFNQNYFDILIITGKSSSSNFLNFPAKKILYGNSYDYEKIENKNFNDLSYKYSVYLDEILFEHPDEKLLNLQSIEDGNFYVKLDKYFQILEKEDNLKVVVAMHPKRNLEDRKFFDNRNVFYEQTKELVKNCEYVIAHGSTSINFAIIYKKPIIIFTTKNINSHYKNVFVNLKKMINCNIINLDENNVSFKVEKSISEKSYLDFFYQYIRHPKSLINNTWSLLNDEINNKNKGKNKF